MLKYLIPHIPLKDIPALLRFTFIGVMIAGCYGVLHDQITYSIGPEYFHNFKFQQFDYADLGLGTRMHVATIGFLATWWVGGIVGWILARRLIPNQSRQIASRQIMQGFAIVFATGILAGLLGFAYGLWRGPDADYSAWQRALQQYRVSDVWNFMRVGYIHNASYIGGLLGLVLTFFVLRPAKLDSAASAESVKNSSTADK